MKKALIVLTALAAAVIGAQPAAAATSAPMVAAPAAADQGSAVKPDTTAKQGRRYYRGRYHARPRYYGRGYYGRGRYYRPAYGYSNRRVCTVRYRYGQRIRVCRVVRYR